MALSPYTTSIPSCYGIKVLFVYVWDRLCRGMSDNSLKIWAVYSHEYPHTPNSTGLSIEPQQSGLQHKPNVVNTEVFTLLASGSTSARGEVAWCHGPPPLSAVCPYLKATHPCPIRVWGLVGTLLCFQSWCEVTGNVPVRITWIYKNKIIHPPSFSIRLKIPIMKQIRLLHHVMNWHILWPAKHVFKQACCQGDFLWLMDSRNDSSAGSRTESSAPGLVNPQESVLSFWVSLKKCWRLTNEHCW